MNETLANLAHDIESAFELSDSLKEKARDALATKLATPPDTAAFHSADAVLDVIRECLPGWSIHIRGTATHPNGHWHCTLRSSDVRDNDSYAGIGQAPTLSHALLAAVLGALAQSG